MQYLGTVVHNHPYKRYGFIEVENGDRYYFHESECRGAFDLISIDDLVTFEVAPSRKGPRAIKVRIAKPLRELPHDLEEASETTMRSGGGGPSLPSTGPPVTRG
jgi:cold shock CspA family protein